jgi:hypothetical protein
VSEYLRSLPDGRLRELADEVEPVGLVLDGCGHNECFTEDGHTDGCLYDWDDSTT